MEHRYADRKDLRLGVVISLPRLGLIRGYTSDISLGGMFIETDCVAMPVNALVTVSFQLDDDNPMICFQAKAMVVHQRAGGFGLMFDRLEPACTRALRNMIAAPVLDGRAEAIESDEATKPAEAYPRWANG